MKKLLALTGVLFFVLPGLVLGAITTSRNPAGADVTSPVSVSASSDDILTDFFSGDIDPQTWTIAIFDEIGGDDRFGSYVPSSTLSLTEIFNLPVGYQGHAEIQTNENNHNVLSLGSFTIISASSIPVITFPTSTASALVANVSSLISDPGLLTLLVLVVAIPFGFYVIKKIISIIPKR